MLAGGGGIVADNEVVTSRMKVSTQDKFIK